MSESPGASLSEIRSQFVSPEVDTNPFAEEEELRQTVLVIRDKARNFLEESPNFPKNVWLKGSLSKQRYLDGIVSSMRHVEGGQLYILQELQKMKPDIQWYRGGASLQWRNIVAPSSAELFSDEELNTFVLDGGANGVLGRPAVALSFLKLAKRESPVLYSLNINDLIIGVQQESVQLVTEHDYDIRVVSGHDVRQYLHFCKDHLKTQSVSHF